MAETTFHFDSTHSQVDAKALAISKKTLEAYIEDLRNLAAEGGYEASESSICLPADAELRRNVLELVEIHRTEALKYILVIGIGGSNLGAMAITEALRGLSRWNNASSPEVLFADTVEPVMMESFKRLVTEKLNQPDEIAVCIISKSGGTTETAANASVIVDALHSRWPQKESHIIAITDEGSKLWDLAEKEDWGRISIPKTVGGRYSVLSAVGLVPLALAGFDIEQLHDGAKSMREPCLDPEVSPALQSATVLNEQRLKGRNIHDLFVFRPQLESYGKWLRQLTGESVGKEFDLDGRSAHTGITPTVSVGSTDLHSVGQLYLGGPRDKVTTFVYADPGMTLTLPANLVNQLVAGLADRPIKDPLEAILDGTIEAYAKRALPFMTVRLGQLSEFVMGELMQWKMIETMLLAKLMNVNAFDQPNVEEYKQITRTLLESE
ncbi:MAG: hypothetical protein Q8Q20_01245 [bacterium]|nr:hypothetical protein [bacterium]